MTSKAVLSGFGDGGSLWPGRYLVISWNHGSAL